VTPTREYSENIAKFRPWLNERTHRSIPYEELGLKDGAPEEAKAAYAKYLKEEERRHERGLK
jgi:hypothetical protein